MISITVDNFQDEESLAVYQLSDDSSVLDLKAEIEATEGIPIGHQRLVYCSRDLGDDEILEFVIRVGKSIIHLCQTRIYLHLLRAAVDLDETKDSHQEKTIHVDVDLDKPIDITLPWDIMTEFGESVGSFSVESIISLSDLSRPLSYYGICNGNTIDIVFGVSGDNGSTLPIITSSATRYSEIVSSPFAYSTSISYRIVRAKYDWDGGIMHPSIQGLPLQHNALIKVIPTSPSSPQWLYGSLVNPTASTSSTSSLSGRSWLASFFRTKNETIQSNSPVNGYLPETFVSSSEADNAEEDLKTVDKMPSVPPLPPFQFPPAKSMIFHMPISDKGHTFLKITANYELLSSPIDPTQVTITVLCFTHDIRRISSVSLFVETPETTVSNVNICENEAHREEIHVDKEVTGSRSRGAHIDGFNIGAGGASVGLQGGISRKHSIGSTEKGTRVLRRKVDAKLYNDNTISWSLKAPATGLDEDGLTGEESITFTLTKKPVQFKYKCRVTHSKAGVEKTMERVSKA